MNLKSNNLLTIVSVNATIIGILIAVILAVAVYYKQIVHEAEIQVIQQAEKINTVVFEKSTYYPAGSKSPWAKEVIRTLDFFRKNAGIKKKHETSISKYEIPISKEDISELYRYLGFLSEPLWATGNSDEFSLGNNKYIPRDLANRGEEIMSVINYLTLSDIFPESAFSSPVNFREGPQKHLYFSSIDDVNIWLIKIETFVFEFKKYKVSQIILPETKFIDSLKKRDRKLIAEWKKSLFRKQTGYIDPDYLFNDFMKKSEMIKSVAENTRYAYNKYEFLSKRYSLMPLFIISLLLLITFTAGVVLPLLKNNISQYIYLHLPVIFYILSFLGMLYWLIRK